jgi:Carboxypeptidase regulatory-like domain
VNANTRMMRGTFWRSVLLFACLLAFSSIRAAIAQEKLLGKASRLFGEPLNVEHQVYRLNDNYVIWLIFDAKENLFQVDVGPKSYYSSEFPNALATTEADRLSNAEYEGALRKISQLKDIGVLRQRHESAVASDFGRLNTDQFAGAFVDRVLADNSEEEVKKFNVYFFQDYSGAPEQVKTLQGQPMVCLVGVWYYVNPETESQVTIGQWQSLRVAGPNLHGTKDCFRSTVLHDADGFTIEEPQNEIIFIAEPFRARVLEGRATVSDQPVPDANVEVLSVGGTSILRSKTDQDGNFAILDAPDGEYKFKVTKDGFKALSGKIVLDRSAPSKPLSFEMHLGT